MHCNVFRFIWRQMFHIYSVAFFKIFWTLISPPRRSFQRNSLSDNVYFPLILFDVQKSKHPSVHSFRQLNFKNSVRRNTIYCFVTSLLCWSNNWCKGVINSQWFDAQLIQQHEVEVQNDFQFCRMVLFYI